MLVIIMVVTMVLAAIATLVIFFALGEREPKVQPVTIAQLQAAQTQITQQAEQLAALQSRIEQLEQTSGATASVAATPAPSANELYASTLDNYKLRDELASLRSELNEIRTQASNSQSGAEQKLLLTLQLNRLRQVAERGSSFTHELTQVRQTAATSSAMDEVLRPLDAYAAAGIVAHDQLLQQYRSLATAWDKQLQDTGAQEWTERLIMGLKNLVSIRAIDQFAVTPALNDLGVALAQRRYESAWAMAGTLADRLPINALRDQIQARATLERVLAVAEQQILDGPASKLEGQP
jgi:hypothetical protein